MRIKKVQLKEFKRFDDLTIDLGSAPKKIIALVGPNGCGKSSVFDAFEEKLKDFRHIPTREDDGFFSKAQYFKVNPKLESYDRARAIIIEGDSELNRKSFYIRTAYRFTGKFDVTKVESLPEIFSMQDEPTSSISLDQRLKNNYRRLIGIAYDAFDTVGTKTGNEIKEELLHKLNSVLSAILDIKVSSLGNVIQSKGQLYFEKGNVTNFPYANLSAGEKEVIDIVLDLIVKTAVYTETVFCIDEPELHINTAIQRALIIEIEKLIPENCQLWIATHSIGFLRAMQEELKDKVQVIDFSEKEYFTGTHVISPMKMDRNNWKRIFSTALEDLTGLVAPKRIIYSEGKMATQHKEEKGLDAKVFNRIFGEAHPDTLFVSSGGNTELDQRSEIAIAILGKVFSDVEIWVLKDRDFDSGKFTDENRRQLYLKHNSTNHRVLNRWEIENYLFDKEVLKKYCADKGLSFNEGKYDSHVTDIINQNVKDDCAFIKACCDISFSINCDVFIYNLAEYITTDTNVFKELQICIFERK